MRHFRNQTKIIVIVGSMYMIAVTSVTQGDVLKSGAWTHASIWPAPNNQLAVFVTHEDAWDWTLVAQDSQPSPSSESCTGPDLKELEVRSVTWAPNSAAFAMEVFSDDVAFLHVCRLGNPHMQTLDFGTITSQGAHWSPDGDWLFFSPGLEDPEGSYGIYGFKLSTGQVFRLARDRTWLQFAVGTTHFLAVEVRQTDLALVRVLREPLEEAAVEVARWDGNQGKFVLKYKEP